MSKFWTAAVVVAVFAGIVSADPIVVLEANPLVASEILHVYVDGQEYNVDFVLDPAGVVIFDGDPFAAANAIRAALNAAGTPAYVSVPGVGSINNFNVYGSSTHALLYSNHQPGNWNVSSATFNEEVRASLSPVPEPATGWLIAAGCAVFFCLRRRHRALASRAPRG